MGYWAIGGGDGGVGVGVGVGVGSIFCKKGIVIRCIIIHVIIIRIMLSIMYSFILTTFGKMSQRLALVAVPVVRGVPTQSVNQPTAGAPTLIVALTTLTTVGLTMVVLTVVVLTSGGLTTTSGTLLEAVAPYGD